MSKFTSGKWNLVERPVTAEESNTNWYLVGAPERAIGLIRHKADARLIASAPEMYELLKVWTHRQAQPDLRIAQERARVLLARIDGEQEGTDD